MEKKVCFKLDERDGKNIIIPIMDNIPLTHTNGSFNLLPARLMGLSYANYLRMCRDMCGATIVGKGSMYPVPYFGKSVQEVLVAKQLVKLLNGRANVALWDRSNPDMYTKLMTKREEEEKNV